MLLLKPFTMDNYDLKKPFSSFFPGVSGKNGIPIWAFYCNRGQGITSFGVKDKNGAILEFNPAAIAYEKVQTQGFRTFLKANGHFIEPFTKLGFGQQIRKMRLTSTHLLLEETDKDQKYLITVEYFTLPEAPLGALMRTLTFKNLANRKVKIELLDGLSQVLPRGLSNGAYKDVGNLMRSWMDVVHLENHTPFFKMRSSSADEAEVHTTDDGNFYLAKDDKNQLLKPIVDADLVFKHDLSKQIPYGFIENDLNDLLITPQYPFNKVPCAFFGVAKTLGPGEEIRILSMIGMAHEYGDLENYLPEFLKSSFFETKSRRAEELVLELTKGIETVTAYPDFDEYLKQSFLDNVLRGGFPINLGCAKNPKPFYLYSRKHGDPERDYNWFNLEPEYYTQGNGNYRDINQNRRNDVLFNRFLGTANIRQFMNLIQLDGYNPLSINGSSYRLNNEIDVDLLLADLFKTEVPDFRKILSKEFTPGKIYQELLRNETKLKVSPDEALKSIFTESLEETNATFGEGYWIDHFTYNFDLIESYLLKYPDQLEELLFDDDTYMYYQSPAEVLPREEKIGLTSKGEIRQYGALRFFTPEEKRKIGFVEGKSNYHKTEDGDIYTCNLLEKLISLATVKFALLDQSGFGIMMEANKPGWNDAMNGLPGLLASGVSETIELLRIVDFLVDASKRFGAKEITVCQELANLMEIIREGLDLREEAKLTELGFWEVRLDALEDYRRRTKYFLSGLVKEFGLKDLTGYFDKMKRYIMVHLKELLERYEIIPTYLIHIPTKFVPKPGRTPYGLQKVEIWDYNMRALPWFLEAPARFLKVARLFPEYPVEQLYRRIRDSDLFDSQLKLYKTSADLDNETLEIGRIRAFTKGWLERESNFVHMSFKYLYGLLRSGQYDRFYENITTSMPPFMDPNRYGRSIYENVSFIATTNNPDPETHGMGFVARLSGCNAEVVSMWFHMMFGQSPFTVEDSELVLTLKPLVPSSFFRDGILKTKFLGSIDVIYLYSGDLSTFDERIKVLKYELVNNQMVKEIASTSLKGQDAIDVRNGVYTHIKVTLGQQI
ncbi:MAG TPA: cellobiose phosphorylase [Bacilli bacterium]|nr:cellobiose phosphorylase [Bacilli bacterium]